MGRSFIRPWTDTKRQGGLSSYNQASTAEVDLSVLSYRRDRAQWVAVSVFLTAAGSALLVDWDWSDDFKGWKLEFGAKKYLICSCRSC